MNALILCVGKLKENFWQEAAGEYLKRLQRYGRVQAEEVPDLPEGKGASDADRKQIVMKEGEELLGRISPRDHVTALCIDAPQMSSEALALFLREGENTGRREVFVIGGSLGLGENVLARADARLSMSRMTFPHQLARVMLLEQLYRGAKINAGEKYHK